MKKMLLFLAMMVVLAIVIVQTVNHLSRVPVGEYGEVIAIDKTVSLQPGGYQNFGPNLPAGGHIVYQITADKPVNSGVIAEGKEYCNESRILRSQRDCLVDPSSYQDFVFVADTRTPGDVVANTLIMGDRKAGADNVVHVVVYQWGCVKNCPTAH